MKYLPILLFCLACGTAKEAEYKPYRDARFEQPASATRTMKLALLDNGDFVDYQYHSERRDAYPKLEYIGHGKIYAIAGIMQLGKTEYHFFKDKPRQ